MSFRFISTRFTKRSNFTSYERDRMHMKAHTNQQASNYMRHEFILAISGFLGLQDTVAYYACTQ
jgi:hypothetical protein